jgi:hypothetical protein
LSHQQQVETVFFGGLQNPPVVSCQWSAFTNSLSGIASYAVAFGTSAGAFNIMPLTTVSATTVSYSTALTAQQTVDGQKFYCTVKGTSKSGAAASASSAGYTLVTSAPTNVVLSMLPYTGAFAFFVHFTYLEAEAAMAVTSATLWAGSTRNATDVVLPHVYTFAAPGIVPVIMINLTVDASAALVQESIVYVCGTLSNAIGLTSAVACYDQGSLVDRTPPLAFSVWDEVPGTSTPASYSNATSLAAGWNAATDDISGILSYDVQLTATSGLKTPYGGLAGAGPGPVVVVPWFNVGLSLTTTFGITPTPGLTYYTSVRANNGANLSTISTSDGIVVDHTAPATATVYDWVVSGVERSPPYINTTSSWSASWPALIDPESGVVSNALRVMSFRSSALNGRPRIKLE